VLLASLSAAQKTGIAGMAAVFIIFALVCSLVIPRYRPNFPGRHVWAYVVVVLCLFGAMMAVIVVVARETTEAQAAPTTPTATSPAPPTPTSPTPPAPAPTGDPAAGKAVFAAQGCAACHTFKAAGATGTIGPDLDKLAADAQTANRGSVEQYVRESIVTPSAYVVPHYPAGVMPTSFGTTLTKTQLDDLVAFLTQPS
jgi:mono/diheme cytochrome c family protein